MSARTKYTIEKVRELLEARGYILISDSYVNGSEKLDVICKNGHIVKISFRHFLSGSNCFECSPNKKPNIKNIKEEFSKKGWELLSDEYVNSTTKLDFKCGNGHFWKITWNKFRSGKGCAECSKKKRITIEFAKEEFLKRGYKVLDDSYKRTEKINFICNNGHIGSIWWRHFKDNHGCKQCSVQKENNPMWKHSKTDKERIVERKYSEYNDWRINVYQRDRYRCQCCDSNKKINAHHILNYSTNPDIRLDIDNGITLCEKCHLEFHKLYGRYNNNSEQLVEFLIVKRLI